MDREERKRQAKAILEGFFGECFRFSEPRPLKEGIFADLMAACEQRGLPFGEPELKACLSEYVYRSKYQSALLRGTVRYDLSGQECGEITAEQKTLARRNLKKQNGRPKAEKQPSETDNAVKS